MITPVYFHLGAKKIFASKLKNKNILCNEVPAKVLVKEVPANNNFPNINKFFSL